MRSSVLIKCILLFTFFNMQVQRCWASDVDAQFHVSFKNAEERLLWRRFVAQQHSPDSTGERVLPSKIQQMKAITQAGHEVPLYCYATLQNNIPLIEFLKRSQVAIETPLVADDDYLRLNPEWASDLYCVSFFYGENNTTWYDEPVNIDYETLKSSLHGVSFRHLRDIELYGMLNAATVSDDVRLMSQLIEQGFPIGFEDEFGSNLLMHALWSNAFKISEFLIDRGAPTSPAREIGHSRVSDPKKLISLALEYNSENSELTARLERISEKLSSKQ